MGATASQLDDDVDAAVKTALDKGGVHVLVARTDRATKRRASPAALCGSRGLTRALVAGCRVTVRRTKIVASIGPASDPPEVLKGMFDAGLDVVRLNLSHGTIDDTLDRLARVQAVAAGIDRPVGVLADLPGPKVRTGPFPVEGALLRAGAQLRLVDGDADVSSDSNVVAIDQVGATQRLEPR